MLRFQTQAESGSSKASKEEPTSSDSTITIDANTALNISLFPPLFFFSALFYTDVMSTLTVLLSYSAVLKKTSIRGTTIDNFIAVFSGVVALLFRQTNIFWVAVFPAGLSVIKALIASAPPSHNARAMTIQEILQKSWKESTVHDCAVQDAGLQGTIDVLLPDIC
jgi:alpha-1,2-glucosyltransferase